MHPDSPQSDISINSITLVELHKHKMNVQQKTGQMSPETGTEQTFIGKKPMYSVVHTQLKPGEREAQSTTWKHPFTYIQVRRNLIICFNDQLE